MVDDGIWLFATVKDMQFIICHLCVDDMWSRSTFLQWYIIDYSLMGSFEQKLYANSLTQSTYISWSCSTWSTTAQSTCMHTCTHKVGGGGTIHKAHRIPSSHGVSNHGLSWVIPCLSKDSTVRGDGIMRPIQSCQKGRQNEYVKWGDPYAWSPQLFQSWLLFCLFPYDDLNHAILTFRILHKLELVPVMTFFLPGKR